jgi:hypothetical protein
MTTLTNAQRAGFHSCPPPPMRGMNRPGDAPALIGQGWAVQVQESGLDDAVEGGWLTLCHEQRENGGGRYSLLIRGGDFWTGAALWSKRDALAMARVTTAREAEVGLNRPVRIFHAYAGVAEEVR